MKEMWRVIQLFFSIVGAGLGYFLGNMDGPLMALVVFTVADYITGVMCGITDHNLSSEIGFKGICRKVIIFILVGIANIMDKNIGSGTVLRTAVIFFYLSNEGVSILENAAHLGLPIPEKLKKILAQLHNNAEEE